MSAIKRMILTIAKLELFIVNRLKLFQNRQKSSVGQNFENFRKMVSKFFFRSFFFRNSIFRKLSSKFFENVSNFSKPNTTKKKQSIKNSQRN